MTDNADSSMSEGGDRRSRIVTAADEPVPNFHTALLGLYPVLGLYAHNIETTSPWAVARPALAVLVLAAVLTITLRSIYRDRHKAGIAASVLMVALLSGWSVLLLAKQTLLPLISGYPDWVYYAIYVLVFLATVAATWRLSKIPVAAMTSIALSIAVAFIFALVIADYVLSAVFPRGHAWLMGAYFLLVAGVLVYIKYSTYDYRALSVTANWFGLILIGLSFLNILYNRPEPLAVTPPPPIAGAAQPGSHNEPPPDIYFIVAGGHGRADVHRRLYDYDETPFIENMKELGFFHAPGSMANYPSTLVSLASCLNLQYLSDLPQGEGGMTEQELLECYHNNRVFHYLKERDYKIIAASPRKEVYEPREMVDEVILPIRALTEFEVVLLENSALAPIAQLYHLFRTGSIADLRYISEHGRIYQTLDRLEQLPAEESRQPRFIYALMTVPEPPFLFDEDGSWPRSTGMQMYAGREMFTGGVEDYREGYVEQLAFTNEALLRIAQNITANASRPSVVVITSAHGPGSALAGQPTDRINPLERYANMLFVRLPGGQAPKHLDETISLVNLWRALFSDVFGDTFELLDDEAFLINFPQPFTFEPIGMASPGI